MLPSLFSFQSANTSLYLVQGHTENRLQARSGPQTAVRNLCFRFSGIITAMLPLFEIQNMETKKMIQGPSLPTPALPSVFWSCTHYNAQGLTLLLAHSASGKGSSNEMANLRKIIKHAWLFSALLPLRHELTIHSFNK